MKENFILIIILIIILMLIGAGYVGIKYIYEDELNNISKKENVENKNIDEPNDKSNNQNQENMESNNNSTKKNLVEQTQYVKIKVEKKGTLDYEEEIKIEDKNAINKLEEIINQAQEYVPSPEDAVGFDVAPYITFYLKDKTQISALAIDNFSLTNGEKKNLIIVRKNNDDNSKKVYLLKDPLGQEIRELYKKNNI